jgi:hypothetical protein
VTGPSMFPPARPRIQRASYGPFGKGAISSANALLGLTGSLKSARNLTVQGVNQVLVRKGSTVAMTFQDDQGTPANVTSIRAIQPFKDRALVVAHSTATNKVYYYIVKSDFSGWYSSADALTSTTTAAPTGVLWTSITTAPDVSVAEGLGMAFVAHSLAADASGLNWPTYRIVFASSAWGAATLTSDLDANATAESLYFSGVLSFQQHLWGWGFGSGTSAGGTLPTTAPAYDPSKLRFSGAIFTNSDGTTLKDFFAASDSLTEGDRVQSEREKIIAGAVAGNAGLFFGRNNVTRVTGYGRDSWVKEVVDRSYGLVGPKAVASDGSNCYYWSNRGPMRIGDSGPPDALYDPIIEAATAAIGGGLPASIVAGFARDLDQVQWFYQTDTTGGLVKFAAFDTRRQIWLGPDSAIGVQVACAGAIEPVYTTASPPGPPAGAPSLTAASNIAAQQFDINWTSGDPSASTEISYELHTGGTWTPVVIISAGATTYTLSGLSPLTGYDVRIRHYKNGSYSSYSTSTTPYASTLDLICTDPSSCTLTSNGPPDTPSSSTGTVTWGVTQSTANTEVYLAGPSASAPAAGSYAKVYTAAPGTASYALGPVSVTGKYWVKVRHSQSGYTASGYAGPASATLDAYTTLH